MANTGGVSPPRKQSKGRKQRRDSRKGQIRRPNLRRYYRRRLADIRPGDFVFRVEVIRPDVRGRRRRVVLDPHVIGINWEENGPTMTGTVTLKRSDPNRPIAVGDNHIIVLRVKWGRRWIKLWSMRVDGTPSVTLPSGEMTVTLVDPLEGLRRTNRDWEFKKSKKHRPKGWRCHQIARQVCRREGVKIGRLARGEVDIEKLKEDETSGLDIIKAAYKKESDETGRKYVMRFINGKFFVTELKRGAVVYEVGNQVRSVSLEARPKNKKPKTVIEASGRIKKDGKWEKIETTVFRRSVLRRYGRTTEEKSYGRVKSMKHLRDQAKRDLADEIRLVRSASMVITGVPFLKRGDTIFWRNKEPGWHGKTKDIRDRRYAYIKTLSHSVSPGTYETTIDIVQEDPYLKDARRLAEEAREKKSGKGEDDKKKDDDEEDDEE